MVVLSSRLLSAKQAEVLPTGITPEANQALRREAARYIAATTLAMLGAGALGRGALGIRDLFSRGNIPYQPQGGVHRVPMRRPQPAIVPEEEEEQTQLKAAADEWAGGNAAVDMLAKPIYDYILSRKGLLYGDQATQVGGIPLAHPLAITGGVAALAGGWKLMDKVLDARRKRERQKELQRAKARYGKLLEPKTASYGELLEATAQTCLELEKQAQGEGSGWGDMWKWPAKTPGMLGGTLYDDLGKGVGAMGTTALLTALLTGKLSYDYFKGRSRRKLLEEALKRRAATRHGGISPAYVYLEGDDQEQEI